MSDQAVLRVALGEYDTGWHDPAISLRRAGALVSAAAAHGAQLVVLPEMCTTGFTVAVDVQAETWDGEAVRHLGSMAAKHTVHLIAGVAIRESEADERAVNAAILFGPSGTISSTYRKQRLFTYAGEDRVYSAGPGPTICTVEGVRLALFICYDLRFPELFRRVALQADVLVIIANWPASRRAHWDVLVCARAIENQCYVIAVNRTGTGGGIAYDGGSVAYDPWGEQCLTEFVPGCVDIDVKRVRAIRDEFPFLRGRHPDESTGTLNA